MKHILAWLLISVLVLAACGRNDQPETAAPAEVEPAAGAKSLLARVDADAPYVFANLERMPEELVARIWEVNEALTDPDDPTWEELAENEDLPPMLRALIREISRISTRSGWEAAGLHSNPLIALHGISVFPVLHYELHDAGAFAATLQRIETEAGLAFPRREVEGRNLIWVPIGEAAGMALHHDDEFATLALVPDHPETLARVAGASRPGRSLDTEPIETLNRRYGFTPHGSGFVDWGRLTEYWLDLDDERLNAVRDRTDYTEIARDPACIREYRAVNRALPRLVVGSTHLDRGSIKTLMRQEVSGELGGRLAPIADTPVALDRELRGLANAGVAINLLAARDFARKQVAGWVDNPPECAVFANVAERAPEWQLALNRPIPPLVTNLQGVFLELEDLQMTPEGLPGGGGALAVFMRDPQLLVGMAQMFSPAVAELELKPGDRPQRVPAGLVPQLDGLDLETFLAMGENALGLAVGEENLDLLASLMESGQGDRNILSFKLNYARLAEILAAAPAGGEDNGALAAHLEQQRRQLQRLGEVYEESGMQLWISEAGIDLRVNVELK